MWCFFLPSDAATELDCTMVPLFLSFFCCSALKILMCDVGMCDARIKESNTRREVFLSSLSSPAHNFYTCSKSFMIRFQPQRRIKIWTVLQSTTEQHRQARMSRAQ